jgi:enoyl-[acyl-carrier protein] reductase II
MLRTRVCDLLGIEHPIVQGSFGFAIGNPGELVSRAHEAGARFVQQVHTVAQAREAAEIGVDVIVAQGSEAGGFGGQIGALALLPQVVDAVAPVPVIAAGGIADGRGLAAALCLGAEGVQLGTRFLASEEAAIPDEWKRRLLEAGSEDAVKIEFADQVFPPPSPGGYRDLTPRALRTPYVDEWNARREEASSNAAALREELMTAARDRRLHELTPFTGQSVGLIGDVLPVAEIVRRLISEAEASLRRAATLGG